MAELGALMESMLADMLADMLKNVFGVEDFWAYYNTKADAEGNVSYNNFNEMFTRALMNCEAESGMLKAYVGTLNAYIGMATQSERTEEQSDKLYTKIRGRVETLIAPVITKHLFKVFDTDGNGTMSKIEFNTSMMMFASPTPEVAAKALFRVIDANGNGSIESIEIAEFLSGLTTAALNLVDAVFEDCTDALQSPFKKHMAMFFMFLSGGNATIDIAASAAKCADEVGANLEEEASMTTEVIQQIMAQVMTVFEKLQDPGTSVFWDTFLVKFNEKAAGTGKIAKADAVRMATDIYTVPLSGFMSSEVLSSMYSEVAPGKLTAQTEGMDLKDVWDISAATGRSFVKGGGLKRFFEAIFNLIDANNDNEISYDELTGLSAAAGRCFNCAMSGIAHSEEGKASTVNMATRIMAIFDSNSDGQLDKNDLESVFDKLVEFARALVSLVVNAAKAVLSASMVPLSVVALNLKAAMLGGAPDALTIDDINGAMAAMQPPSDE